MTRKIKENFEQEILKGSKTGKQVLEIGMSLGILDYQSLYELAQDHLDDKPTKKFFNEMLAKLYEIERINTEHDESSDSKSLHFNLKAFEVFEKAFNEDSTGEVLHNLRSGKIKVILIMCVVLESVDTYQRDALKYGNPLLHIISTAYYNYEHLTNTISVEQVNGMI